MQIVLPTILLIGLTNIIGLQVLVPLGKEKEVFFSVVGGGITDLIACFVLIPYYGVIGAALSNLLAEFTVLVLQVYYAGKSRDKINIDAALKHVEYGKILLAIIVAAGVAWQCKTLTWSDFFVLLFSGTVFFSVYAICLYIVRESFFIELTEPLIRKLKL